MPPKAIAKNSLVLCLVVVGALTFTTRSFGDNLFESTPIWTGRNPDALAPLGVSAVVGTTVLYNQKFEVGASCSEAGWTKVDLTAQIGTFFHIDDFSALAPDYEAVDGNQSLWCGARPAASGVLCGYATLPGYGNNWKQFWGTKVPIVVTGDLDVSFQAVFDSEPGYDVTTLEFTTDLTGLTGWTVLDSWSGDTGPLAIAKAYVAGSPVHVRFHFQSDEASSDEDGMWPSNGAVLIDNLQVETIPLEDFESEAVNATSSNDWIASTAAGYGQHMALFKSPDLVQQDPCATNLRCQWAAISGSLANYGCGGFSTFKAVPYGADDLFINNEIWSPNIALIGAGSEVRLQFSVYRDNPLTNLVFYKWRVRTQDAVGCPSPWADLDFVYYGGRDWFQHDLSIGAFLDLANAVGMNISLGVVDMCSAWCGLYGTGLCHGQAPLLDNVKVVRLAVEGPQWAIRDIDQFQDSFPEDGTLTGTVRADIARDINPATNPEILPGDFAIVTVNDPVHGLANDPNLGGKAAYLFVAVFTNGTYNAVKSGNALTGGARWPYAPPLENINSVPWSRIRLDALTVNDITVPNKFCVDLKDDLFTPGDVVYFFYGARNNNGVWTYAYGSNLGATGTDEDEAAANASEFTCLPIACQTGGDILYVDGVDGRGAQPYFDSAFQSMGILDQVDRFDIRGPSSAVNNSPASRVKDIQQQLLSCYRKILWDCGDLSITLGDGMVGPNLRPKTNDYALLNVFLDNLTVPGGVYICGDDVAEQMILGGASAVAFRSNYIPFAASPDHRPAYGTSPLGRGTAGNCFDGDVMVLFGACPLVNDFDILTPLGPTTMEMSYGVATPANGAVLSNVTINTNGVPVRAILSGFAFEYIRTVGPGGGIPDHWDHMHDILTCLSNNPPEPTDVGPDYTNSLSQNYPNPFNPETTISFSLRTRGVVTLTIYNVAGARVRTLVGEEMQAGAYTEVWDGRDESGRPVSSGVYFYKLVSNNFTQTRKMVLLK